MILRKNDGDRYSRVAPEWEGEVCVLIGGGPSLTVEQVAAVRVEYEAGAVHCIGVNDAYLLAPFADVAYFADAKWFRWMQAGIPKPGLTADQVRERWASFAGQKCTIQTAQPYIVDDAVHILRNATFPHHGSGLSADSGAVMTGRNSGFQALNVAILAGAKRIIMIGFDGKPNVDGKAHWFGEHPTATPVSVWPMIQKSFMDAMEAIKAAGVRVVNCSPSTHIDAFQKMTLTDALAGA